MRSFLALLLALPLGAAVIPGRYIVELSNTPIADHAAQIHARLTSPEAGQQRAAIRAEQTAARAAIEAAGGTVTGAVDTVRNALFVSIPDENAAQLSAIPGVQFVHPERLFQKTFEPQQSQHRLPESLSQVGISNAGAGIKIGMIDSGINISHPAFSDAGFTAPSGYPIVDSATDLPYTNNKVIVARNYSKLFSTKDPDPTAQDDDGHGSGTAMVAAGVANAGPLETISGVAPQAYLGIYKVFGTPGINDSAPESAILAAINDAVNDGMDVVNLSLGSALAGPAAQDPEVSAIQSAAAAGVIVVVSAGNSGPNPATVGTPAIAPNAISVGASSNRRVFAGSVNTADGSTFAAQAGSNSVQSAPVGGPLVDITPFDSTGFGCITYPANSLSGAIALIQRGTPAGADPCFFTTKLASAQAAGAVGAVIYDNVAAEPLVLMSSGGAPIPGNFVSQSDGLLLLKLAVNRPHTNLEFATPELLRSLGIAAFSAVGPTADFTVKPDISAVGTNVYTAAESINSAGDLYDPTGYTISQGTSFSSPLVAGAAALVKQARPGLSAQQYRSLLINSADPAYLTPGMTADVQQSGAGELNVLAALNATATVAPVTISFGVSSAVIASQLLTVTNAGKSADTFQISIAPRDSSARTPTATQSSVTLAAGASASVLIQFTTNGLSPGQYEGYVNVQGSHSRIAARVPYWYGVAATSPAFVTVLYTPASASVNATVNQVAIFRVTDSFGLPVTGVTPVATVISGGGKVSSVSAVSGFGSAVFALNAKMGPTAGANVFQIQAGNATVQVSITAQ